MYYEIIYFIICIYDFILIYILIQLRIEEKTMKDYKEDSLIIVNNVYD